MFRKMRRFKQELPKVEAERILRDNSFGVLSLIGDEGYPYGVPLNYLYDEGVLYFHGAATGHKVDSVRKNAKVSFSVIDQDKVVPENLTDQFRSVIAFGKATLVSDDEEKRNAMRALSLKYSKGFEEKIEKTISDEWNGLAIIKVDVEHITGKAHKTLI